MTSMFKNLFVDKLDDTIHEYNDTYHTNNINPVHVKSNTYIDFIAEKNYKDPKFKVHDHLSTSKYRNIFAKRYTLIEDLNGEQYFGTYYEKELQKTNQSCDKLYMSS